MRPALAIGLACLLAAAPACAQDAREEFVLGTRALEENRVDDALAHFERSYTSSRNPAALFNVARTQFVLGRYAAAAQSAERLLADHPDVAAPLRAQTEDTLERARARLARIVFLYDPPVPRVHVDGHPRSPEGDPPTLVLDPGPHVVSATRPGMRAFRWQGELAAGTVTPLRFEEHVAESAPLWPWLVGGAAVLVVAAAITLAVVLGLDAQLAPRHDRVLRP